jgi:cyanophycinase-like exopeptidase
MTQGPAQTQPGKIALFGSGETAPAGRQVHEVLFQELGAPIRVAVLETPAGFQPNSAWVAGRLAEFIEQSLQNFHPQATVVPVRRRDGPNSTNDRQLSEPLLAANYIFAGPGSPSYAVRHLADTWTWHVTVARQRRGAVLALASAAAIAVSAHALPVYEIYKAGSDLHWLPGLDLLRPYGLELAIVTHWNNQDGGETLDTCCAFVGQERMARLEAMLPPTTTLLGIDEHTAVVLDFAQQAAQVMGQSGVMVRRPGESERRVFVSGQTFDLNALGEAKTPELDEGLPAEAVEAVLSAEQSTASLPPDIAALIEEREAARREKDWAHSDALRERLADRGYLVEDTPQGPRWRRVAIS